MQRTQHPLNNSVLGAPEGWDQKELPCYALPITRVECDGFAAVVLFWRPAAEELAQLSGSAVMALWAVGSTMPRFLCASTPGEF
jgi:hypothetical protein